MKQESTHDLASRNAEVHTVFNQSLPLTPLNLFTSDLPLAHYFKEGANDVWNHLKSYGELAGGVMTQWGQEAHRDRPRLQVVDRYGHRIEQVDYNAAYHQLMATALEHGHHNLPYTGRFEHAGHRARAAMIYLHYQADPGTGCPLTMTSAAVPALSQQPDVFERWRSRILSGEYSGSNKPWFEKPGVTVGMAMTEKQGGSDVAANTSRALATGAGDYELVGHKWFCSAPMSDGFLTLAKTSATSTEPVSCFLVPRFRDDGSHNQIYIRRLKDKLGNNSNASSEIEYRGAAAHMIGPEGRGVATIINMVVMTRFDCVMGSAALMRQGVAEALNHALSRQAFGKPLINQPLMRQVLASMALESEAGLHLGLYLAHLLDQSGSAGSPGAAGPAEVLLRLAVAPAKYLVCKHAVGVVAEALECLGGAGYVEEFPLSRLYREAPLNSLWEGCGNIQCLDVLRALGKQPDHYEVLRQELQRLGDGDRLMAEYLHKLDGAVGGITQQPQSARVFTSWLGRALQTAAIHRAVKEGFAPGFLLEAWQQYLSEAGSSLALGTVSLPEQLVQQVLERNQPNKEV